MGVPLTPMLASPFMALFANITDLDTSLHVMDLLILQRCDALVSIVTNVLAKMKESFMGLKDIDSVHLYLVK